MIPVLAVLLAAQAHGAHGGPSRPPEELGRVVFPISCTATAQQDFQRGMALMHSFWYEEAGEAFQQAARADRTCAMAHWGDAMSRLHAIWGYDSRAAVRAGRAAIERAAALDAKTDRERDYVTAAAAYFAGDDSLSHDTRMEAYEAAMERVYRRHPADDEAAMLYALALVGNAPATDTTFAKRRRAGAILEPIFARQPNHPGLAHYIIHAYDSPVLAERAVPAARRYAEIAPSVPHARHMPSHIFNTLGMWDDAIRSDSNALAALRDTAVTDILRGHRLHSLDYQQYAFLQEGRDAEAARASDEARAVLALMATRRPYYAATLPARLLLERGRWAEAARLDPGNARVTQYARGLGAARSGDTALARAAVAELTRLEGGGEGGLSGDQARDAQAWRLAVSAWLARATGDTAAALRDAEAAGALEETADVRAPGPLLPARELQGELLIELGRYAEARAAFGRALRRSPNRARSLFGAARAAELDGDGAAARARYGEFLKLMEQSDGDRPELALAKRFVARL